MLRVSVFQGHDIYPDPSAIAFYACHAAVFSAFAPSTGNALRLAGFSSINSGLSSTSLALAPVLTPEIVEDPSCTEAVVQ